MKLIINASGANIIGRFRLWSHTKVERSTRPANARGVEANIFFG